MQEAQRLGAGSAYTAEYAVNSEGERTYLKYPNDYQIDYTSDDLHRVTKIEENSGGLDLVRYEYLGGYLSETILGDDTAVELHWGTGFTTLPAYDSFGRLVESTYDPGGYNYRIYMGASYDYASNVTERYDGLRPQWNQPSFTYDQLHRLVRGTQYAGAIVWEWDDLQAGGTSLDKLGNWVNFSNAGTTDARTHNTANEITARTLGETGCTITYDVAGNLATFKETPASVTWTFTYDYRNRLLTASDGSLTTTYSYDALNRRVKKHLTSTNDIMYTYDGWRCVEESEYIGEQWVPKRQYVYGAHYLDELVARDDLGASPETYFFLQDTNYNVVALYRRSSGSIVERYWYEPYGKVTIAEEDGSSQGDPVNKVLLFQGQRRDPETELCYFKNRYYSPVLGRFVQRDPGGYQDGMNAYEFTRSGAIRGVDMFGLATYFVIYYVNPRTDRNRSFERAAKTWIRSKKSSPDWNPDCDVIIEIPVTTPDDFIDAWEKINETVLDRKAQNSSDEFYKIKEGVVFSHGSAESLHFAMNSSGKHSIYREDIAALAKLDWAADAAGLRVAACYSGVTELHEWFAEYQGTTVYGETGKASFSEHPERWVQIDQKGSGTSTEVYLGTFHQTRIPLTNIHVGSFQRARLAVWRGSPELGAFTDMPGLIPLLPMHGTPYRHSEVGR